MSVDFSTRWQMLTEEDREIARVIARSEITQNQMAARMNLAIETFHIKMQVIYRVLGVKRRAAALAFLLGRHYDEVYQVEEVRKTA